MSEELDELEKSLKVFNRDVTTIPCFRNSFLYGIESGLASGLAYFLFTSNTRKATHVGFTSYIVVTMSYWCYCRWRYTKIKFQYNQLQSVMRKQSVYEGTAFDVTKDEGLQEVKYDR